MQESEVELKSGHSACKTCNVNECKSKNRILLQVRGVGCCFKTCTSLCVQLSVTRYNKM